MNTSTTRLPATAAERADRGLYAPATGAFAALPHALRKDPRLRGRDKAVLLVAALLEYARGKPSCWPSNRRLADDMGCSPRTVQIALKALQAAGWVRVELGADTPTGRRLVLAWREADCAPPSSRVAPDPAQPVAPEGRSEKERQRPESAAGVESPPPPAGDGGEDVDMATLHQWAEGRDAILRRIAGRRLAELAAEAGAVTAEPAVEAVMPAPVPAPPAEASPSPPVVPPRHMSAAKPSMGRPYSQGLPGPGGTPARQQPPVPAVPQRRDLGPRQILERIISTTVSTGLPVWAVRSSP